MRIDVGDIWSYTDYAIVVPVNLGRVSGRGIAKQARDRWGWWDRWLRAVDLEETGIGVAGSTAIAFPVKYNWRDKADLELMVRSLIGVRVWMESEPHVNVAMPLVGCGFGELVEEEVMPLVEEVLGKFGDRVVVVRPAEGLRGRYPAAFKASVRRDRTAK